METTKESQFAEIFQNESEEDGGKLLW